MVSTFTTNKRIEQPANGDYAGNWNVPVNADWAIIDAALGGVTNINVTGISGTVVLSAPQYQPMIINFSGVLTANVNYQLPAGVGGRFIINNATTGTFSITISSGGGGITNVVAQGLISDVYSDGTNIQPSNTSAAVANGSITNAKLANMANNTIKANVSGGGAPPSDVALSTLLDTISNAQGSLLYRNASSWVALPPALAGQSLQTFGPSTNPAWAAFWPLGAINGLLISLSTATSVGISAGICANGNGGTTYNLTLPSAITKTFSNFSSGSGNGGLDTGSISANTWYNVFIIRRDSDGTTDGLISLSPTSPTMPAGYTANRRLGSFKTNNSSQITPFTQVGDWFIWSSSVNDASSVISDTTAHLVTLSVPPGVSVEVEMTMINTSNSFVITYVSSPYQGDELPQDSSSSVPGYTVVAGSAAGSRGTTGILRVLTNTSSQIRFRNGTATNTTVGIFTYGWRDTRGK